MKISNARKYFSLNLLSILGYLCLLGTICLLIFVLPVVHRLDLQVHDGGMGTFYFWAIFLTKCYIAHLVLSGVLLIAAIIEFFFKRQNKVIKIPIFFEKLHPLAFWFGLVLVPLPIYIYLFSVLLI